MAKWLKFVGTFLLVALCATPVMAQGQGVLAQDTGILFKGLAGVGAGLVLIGAALGIGKIGAAACESMARQPEMAGRVQTAMIISAALIEGAAFFALLVCMLTA